MKLFALLTVIVAGLLLALPPTALAATYHVDADGGSDLNDGRSPAQAWRTLARVNAQSLLPGDEVLLERGDNFAGKIFISGATGTAAAPIVIGAYGVGARPVINASGYLAGVHIRNAAHIEVRDLTITANGGVMVDGSPEGERYGVLANATSGNAVRHVSLCNLHIHNIFPSIGKESEGANPTTHFGYGVFFDGHPQGGQSEHFLIENCTIERTGHRGIHPRRVNFVNILNNTLTDIGGPGIQPSTCNDVVVRGNVVTRSGSYVDPRMHGRGSGIWPWTCQRVLIERNTFSGARGRADSCGIHIDFNCSHVVVQYNLSIDNSGGFIEILGNTYNNTYRYNISINDGARVNGQTDQGSLPNQQDGHIIWISGYAAQNPNNGPFLSYLYNNTIYMGPGTARAFHIQQNARGLLIANNIFYIQPTSFDGTASHLRSYSQQMIDSVVWENNLYQRSGIIPTSFPFRETPQTIGDPQFANPGGLAPEDYIPAALPLIVNQGIVIEKLPGDLLGLQVGLAVTEDFFGNPIVGLPDMGAIEVESIPVVLPAAAFHQVPTPVSPAAVTMSAVPGPPGTEYFFAETTGNFGGANSGWQLSASFTPGGLLPNTTYAYTVRLRHAFGGHQGPGAPLTVLLPRARPYEKRTLFEEDFSSLPDPANQTSPFPAQTWYTLDEAQSTSVASTPDGKLQVGWGFDQVTVLYRTNEAWDLSKDYTLAGAWEITTVLDVHQGFVVGIGEFNASNGNLIRRVKGLTVGDLTDPMVGQTGTFIVALSAQEINAAGVSASSRIGLYIDHPGDISPNRNDVYLVDNLRMETSAELVDSDGDGIPDADELLLGLNPNHPADGAFDADGDGFTNAQEYLMGTDMDDSTSFLQTTIQRSGDQVSIRLPQAYIRARRWYLFEVSTDLQTWTVANGVRGADVTSDLLFPVPSGDIAFGRIRVEWSAN